MIAVVAALALAFPWTPAFSVTCHSELYAPDGRQAAALYQPASSELQLLRRDCRTLRKLVHGSRQQRSLRAQSWAVYVLGHELAHHRGILDETAATCWGLRNVKRIGRALGARRPAKLRRIAIRLNQYRRPPYRCSELAD